MSSLPTIALNADFAGAGTTNIGANVRNASWSISRGTQQPSLTGLIADAGELTATLSNRDRKYDPSYSSGPYFGDLVPGVPAEFVATYNAIDYTLFVGQIMQWPQIYPSFRIDQVAQIRCSDGVRNIARAQTTTIFPAQLSGDRIASLLTDIAVQFGTDIQTGTSRVPFFGDGLSSSSVWSLASDACSAEWGALFFSADGTCTYLDRNSLHTSFATSQATFGDGGGAELKFADVIIGYDDTRIVNDADLLYDRYGSKAHAEDLTSQGEPWGKISWQQNFQVASGMLARSYAHEVVRRFANPTVRIEQLIVKPLRDPANLWPKVLSLDVGQRITIKVTPLGGGSRIVKDVFIRGINHAYGNGDWVTTYSVDDGDLDTVTFYLDGATLLDGSARLSF